MLQFCCEGLDWLVLGGVRGGAVLSSNPNFPQTKLPAFSHTRKIGGISKISPVQVNISVKYFLSSTSTTYGSTNTILDWHFTLPALRSLEWCCPWRVVGIFTHSQDKNIAKLLALGRG